jgi:predicted transcriptional regulator
MPMVLFMPKKQPPRLKITKKVVTFNLPDTTHELLDKAAEATGINRSAYVDRAVKEQCKRDGISE